ncbi:MAG TPA: hypothetical protein VH394_04470 [Thermoanaerobaculia bacterium]|nr:hypothetical protein [Thermoanaerobaculia bacterium]
MKTQLTGILLFLFIPLVLFLFVRHPEPIGASLVGGVVLMLGHRFLARPYMERSVPVKCVWCNRVLPAGEGDTLDLQAGERVIQARCCAGHREPAAKYFSFLASWRWVLRAGIFGPLLILLGTLAAAAFGRQVPVDDATALFKLVVGITVNLAAFGYFAMPPVPGRLPTAVPFPVHNFFLLGVRNLLWVFRLVGIWWIWQGLRYFLHL